MKKFKPSMLTLGLITAGLCSPVLYAQEDQQEEQEVASDSREGKAADGTEIIEVRGFRRSLIQALNTKRFSDTVVDAISADDIGGLPDVSIADALSRIPGVTSVRIDGQSSELNIRGLGGEYVMTTLNGREMVSTSGGRAIEFDQFPSELIQQAQIYKSQKASLIEGGVAGSVELQTVNALNLEEESAFRLTVQGNTNSEAQDNPDASDFGTRVTLSWQQKLFDDTLGYTIGYARLDQPAVSSRFVSYGGDIINPSAFQIADGTFPTDADGNPLSPVVSPGFELNQRAGDLIRDSFVGSLNWHPTDDLTVTWDGFYSEFDSIQFDRGILVGESNAGTINRLGLTSNLFTVQNPTFAQNGGLPVLVGATFLRDPDNTVGGSPAPGGNLICNCLAPQIQNDNSSSFSSTLATGLNIEWQVNDRLTLTADFSHTEAEEEQADEVMRLVMFQDSSAQTPIVQDTIRLDYQLNGLAVPDILFDLDFTNVDQLMAASYERYPRFEENEASAARFDLKYELDSDYFSSIEAGVRISERSYELRRGVYRNGSTSGLTEVQMRQGQYINYGVDADGNIVPTGTAAPFQLTEANTEVVNFSGPLSGVQPFRVVSDVAGLVSQWITEDTSALPRWGVPNGVNAEGRTIFRDPTPWSVTDGSVVEEEITAAYISANLNFELGDMPVTGNVGLRAIDTKQRSLGLVQVGNGFGDIVADAYGNTRDDYQFQVSGDDYRHYLPSFNFNVQLNDNDQLRIAYAKVLARPDLNQMRNGGAYSLSLAEERTDFDGNRVLANYVDLNAGGNPALRPFEADQLDISFEKYFSETDGAFIFALWYKDINNFPETLPTAFFDFQSAGITLPEFTDDSGNVIQTANGTYTRPINLDDAGFMKGVELAYTQTLSFLPGMWSGLGVNVNFSYTDSEILIDASVSGAPADFSSDLPGLSRRVWTGTVFYEYEDFEARISSRFRSPYFDEQVAIGVAEPAFFTEETIVSAQMNYDITENLQIFASADNLTDEPNLSYFGSRAQTGTLQYFGRHFYFGVNYKL